MNPAVAYWHRGMAEVEWVTGATEVMDGHDLRELAAAFDMPYPFGAVLDVGCGTGRAAGHCRSYLGVDISPSCVEYCLMRGIAAQIIDGPQDLADMMPCDLILCLSVFTHIAREEQQAYLARFAEIAPEVIVDVIPGDGSGSVPLWTTDLSQFRADIARAGFVVSGQCDRLDPSIGVPHHYLYLSRP